MYNIENGEGFFLGKFHPTIFQYTMSTNLILEM